MNIGKNIANLRKAKNMTQEELAEIIGVSAQAVSKWENGANLPDTMLLPVIAGTFGVTIDALFGTSAEAAIVPFDDIPDAVSKNIRNMLFAQFDNPSDCPHADDEKCMTTVCSDKGGCTFMNRDLAVNLLHADAKALLAGDTAADTLTIFTDKALRKVLAFIIETPISSVTPAYISKNCDLSMEDAQIVLSQLCSLQLAAMKNIEVDGNSTVVCTLELSYKLPLILTILQLADLCGKNLWYYGYRGTRDFEWLK